MSRNHKPFEPPLALVAFGVSVEDVRRFSDKLPERAASAAAIAWAALREVQLAVGPGHAALDVLVEEMPEAYRRNWAKKLLKVV